MERLQIALFLFFILGFGLWHLVSLDKDFSAHENRPLQTLPNFSLTSIKNGNFMDQFESYVADQFPKRNSFLALKGITERAGQKKENNDILFGQDGYLFEAFTMNQGQAFENIEAINEFAGNNESLDIGFMLAPTSISIYPERAPRYSPSDNEIGAIKEIYGELDPQIHSISVAEALVNQKDHPIYFRTDHHWTMLGAYEAYALAADIFDFDPQSLEDFVREQVSDNFYGSFYSKANDWRIEPDVMEYLRPEEEVKVHVSYDDGSEADSLVWPEALSSRDQYRYFLGGNYGLVKIETDIKNGKRLLVVKDSYAHVLVPFFTHHYEEIHMVDLRYFREQIGKYADREDIDDLLIIYNIANFVDDKTLRRISYD